MTVRPQPALQAPIPSDSVLIYRPDRRQQLWRFISYMVLHANWFHLSFNVVIQLLFGIPLEVMHGSARIAVIYFAGVFAGSLGTSVVDSEVYLVGASGGVYALLAAHLANIMLNYGQMKYAVAQLVSVLIFGECSYEDVKNKTIFKKWFFMCNILLMKKVITSVKAFDLIKKYSYVMFSKLVPLVVCCVTFSSDFCFYPYRFGENIAGQQFTIEAQ